MHFLKLMMGCLLLSFSTYAEDSEPFKLKLMGTTGLGYNTNPYSLTSAQKNQANAGDINIRVRPEIKLTMNGQRFHFNLGGGTDLNWLLGLSGKPGFLAVNALTNTGFDYNQGGKISLNAAAGFQATRAVGEVFIGNVTTLGGTFSLGTVLKPFDDRWSLTLQGDYAVRGYVGSKYGDEDKDLSILNNQTWTLGAKLGWRFLPRTQLYLESRYGFFLNGDLDNQKIKSNPFSFGAGLMGQITQTISGSLGLYWQRVFLSQDSSSLPQTSFPFGARLNFNWQYEPQSSLGLAMSRELRPSPIFLDEASNSLGLTWSHVFPIRFTLSANLQGGLIQYGKPSTSLIPKDYRTDSGASSRQDLFVGAGVTFSYSFKEWFAAGINGSGDWRWTNADASQILNSQGLIQSGGGYQWLFQAYQGNVFARFTY